MSNLTYQPDLSEFYTEKKDIPNNAFTFLKNKITVNLSLPFRSNRKNLEAFVFRGFKNYYQANIQHFLPNLVSISKGNNVKSVIGFRSASSQPLFIEQYLDHSIETYFKNEAIERHQLGEFGNLIGTNRALTLQLFIITFVALSQNGLKKLVFCATPQVKSMFENFSVSTQYLGSANPQKIGAQLQHWGSYYDTQPELLAIDVKQVMSIIENSNQLSSITAKYSKEINQLYSNLIH